MVFVTIFKCTHLVSGWSKQANIHTHMRNTSVGLAQARPNGSSMIYECAIKMYFRDKQHYIFYGLPCIRF